MKLYTSIKEISRRDVMTKFRTHNFDIISEKFEYLMKLVELYDLIVSKIPENSNAWVSTQMYYVNCNNTYYIIKFNELSKKNYSIISDDVLNQMKFLKAIMFIINKIILDNYRLTKLDMNYCNTVHEYVLSNKDYPILTVVNW